MRKRLLDLKIELVKRGLSQAALARAVGRSPSQISRVIRGISRPRVRDKKRIAEFLGVEQARLFRVHRRRKIEERVPQTEC
jgi:transcriptional regulator with XRE-family HTH domain